MALLKAAATGTFPVLRLSRTGRAPSSTSTDDSSDATQRRSSTAPAKPARSLADWRIRAAARARRSSACTATPRRTGTLLMRLRYVLSRARSRAHLAPRLPASPAEVSKSCASWASAAGRRIRRDTDNPLSPYVQAGPRNPPERQDCRNHGVRPALLPSQPLLADHSLVASHSAPSSEAPFSFIVSLVSGTFSTVRVLICCRPSCSSSLPHFPDSIASPLFVVRSPCRPCLYLHFNTWGRARGGERRGHRNKLRKKGGGRRRGLSGEVAPLSLALGKH